MLGRQGGARGRLDVVDDADHLPEDPMGHTGVIGLGRNVDQGLEVLQCFCIVHVGTPSGNQPEPLRQRHLYLKSGASATPAGEVTGWAGQRKARPLR